MSNVNFGIKRGTVHVLIGENGAGKSTLLKVINGLYKADAGQILFNGEEIHINGPSDALKAGISMIYQELNIIPEMTVLENIYLGREAMKKFGRIDRKTMYKYAREFLDRQGLQRYDLNRRMKDLSVAEAQMIEIVKAISVNAKVILMDEPTSSLTEKEVDYLFAKISELKAAGISIVFISHKMDEIFRVADYTTVFRDGAHIKTQKASETSIPEIIEMMVGRRMTEVYPKKDTAVGEEVFKIENFTKYGVFEGINISLKRGEILGVSGLVGAGRTEIMRAVIGLDPHDEGKIYIEGEEVSFRDVNDSIDAGIIMIPEDRRRHGLNLVQSVGENISLVAHRHVLKSLLIKHRRLRKIVSEMIRLLTIKTPSVETKVETLSGGNQQKVVLGKWLAVKPKILIMDEPTRGIDVGTKYEIYKLMHQMNSEGISIIMVDS
ncbi:MAG: sugar ABC transporter ATP-binding protein, partial [Synergistaceae bacterium]|nr:sugar ABC transporter ATP-binding protein [Synergistaceae bacterium]